MNTSKTIEELEAELLAALRIGRKIDWGIPKDLYESVGIKVVPLKPPGDE